MRFHGCVHRIIRKSPRHYNLSLHVAAFSNAIEEVSHAYFRKNIVFNFFCFVVKSEVKLSELSEVVGNYEKLRLQDQQAIQKLKERLQKLDVENATLTRQISTDENRTPDNERDLLEDETPEELKKQVFKLKGLLKIAMDSSDKPLDLGTYIYYFGPYATCMLNDVDS